MITDIQKYKNDNLFSDQVLVLLMFSNGRKCEICRMITDIQKYKNDNLFSDQVLVLLMFSNGRKCEVVMKIVVLLICILTYRC